MPDKARVRVALEERIRHREMQLASFGIEAPPHVQTDLEEARRGLAALDALEPPPVSREVQEVISAVPQSERERAAFLAILTLNADVAELKKLLGELQEQFIGDRARDYQERIERQRETDGYRVSIEQRLGNVRMALAANAVATVLGWIFRRR